ncbi:MAG: FUSC family protein [Anaerovorax sp.]
MTFKLILNKTVTFLGVSLGVLVFQYVFGADNVIVGVGVIVQALFLLGINMTIHPIKNTLYIIALNFMLGLCACIVLLNPWFGLFLNFAMVFITVYLLMNDLTTPMYFPFMLTYIFMLMTAPIGFSQLPLRLGALVCGSLLIIALQLICNRNKSAKISNSVFDTVAKTIITQINALLDGTPGDGLNQNIGAHIRKMSQAMNERKRNNFFVSPTTLYKLNIGFCLERISLIVSEISEIKQRPKVYDDCLKDMIEILNVFEKIHADTITPSDFKQVGLAFLQRYKDTDSEYIEIYELIQVVDILRKRIYQLSRIRGVGVKASVFEGDIPKEFSVFYHLKKNLANGSIRFSFALRAALAISLTSFCTDLFQLEYGRWMVFTAFIIIQPYAEDAKEKFKKRIIGTLFGLVIFTLLFTLIEDSTGRALIMLLAGYISSYLKSYDKQMICITVSALGAAAIGETGSMLFEFDRIFYIILGGIVAMLLNRFVLRLTLSGTAKNLQRASIDMMGKLSQILLLDAPTDLMKNTCANLLLTANLVEDKLFLNNTILQLPQLGIFMDNQRVLLNDFIFAAFGRSYWGGKDEELSLIFQDMVHMTNFLSQNLTENQWLGQFIKVKETLQQKINLSVTSHEKVYLRALDDILEEINIMRQNLLS